MLPMNYNASIQFHSTTKKKKKERKKEKKKKKPRKRKKKEISIDIRHQIKLH